ncbi:UDP-N-acetylmuramoyl-L-alanyl-D-glutamate--2,6-diaminopimelate ligase [Bacillus sp. VT-16-64]|uniref:UDP-N-acetylmuramoyl-L-alanyl-D-glutamate--2, 6-diaminopimelate ligase n=1 Tax=Siminovitchia sp. FSL W7-1587 TaxID=2954699 RepID=UPI00097DFC54|nr:UDP-N-acetylmuramoyl-L-alanyl-D-glutamate--2,6-diaminopimelate ligase [Bacillus sp. VT-16-64]
MKLHSLLKVLPLTKAPRENPDINSITNDTRKIEPGALFICIKGHQTDGHQFANAAVAKGAVAVLAEKKVAVEAPVILVPDTKRAMAVLADEFYGHPTQRLNLIGITGTNGKTTTSMMIENIFRDAGKKTGLIGTLHIKIGDEKLETKNTTPDNIVLQQTFAHMVEEGVHTVAMEVSSHALIQGRVNGCDFDVAVFTNLSQDHLDYHETMEEYKRAKGLLFSRLGNIYDRNKPKFAVINADDPAAPYFVKETSAHVVTYGIDQPAEFSAGNIQMSVDGASFTLHSPEGKQEVKLRLMGKFSVYNALAAITTAYVANIPLQSAIHSLEQLEGIPGRFEAVNAGQDFTVIVDYAHTPDSLENVLKTIQQFAKKRIFTVVGCGGDRDRTKRPLMAKVACVYSTNPIFTSDNPRTEDPSAILADMEAGVQDQRYKVIPDRKEAIQTAIREAKQGDVVLIAGKGHETYQIIGEKVIDFDDRLVAMKAIEEL